MGSKGRTNATKRAAAELADPGASEAPEASEAATKIKKISPKQPDEGDDEEVDIEQFHNLSFTRDEPGQRNIRKYIQVSWISWAASCNDPLGKCANGRRTEERTSGRRRTDGSGRARDGRREGWTDGRRGADGRKRVDGRTETHGSGRWSNRRALASMSRC